MCTPAHTNTLTYSDTYVHTHVCTHKHMDTLTHMHAHRCVTHEHVSMHTCIHTCTQFTHVHVIIHPHVYSHLCVYTHVFTLVFTHMHIYAYTYTCVQEYTFLCIHTFTHISMYTYACTTHIHTYVHTHLNAVQSCFGQQCTTCMIIVMELKNSCPLVTTIVSNPVQPSVCLGCCGMHPTVLPILCGPAPTTEQCPALSSNTGWQGDCWSYWLHCPCYYTGCPFSLLWKDI